MALTDDDFVYDGVAYQVTELVHNSNTNIVSLKLTPDPGSKLAGAVLHLGTTRLNVGTFNSNSVLWGTVDPQWTDNQQVTVKLVGPPVSLGRDGSMRVDVDDPWDPVTINEGESINYYIALNQPPTATLTITPRHHNPKADNGLLTIHNAVTWEAVESVLLIDGIPVFQHPNSHGFTGEEHWLDSKEVRLTAVDDNECKSPPGTPLHWIRHHGSGGGPDWGDWGNQQRHHGLMIKIDIIDDDCKYLIPTPTSPVSVEEGGSATYTVRLKAPLEHTAWISPHVSAAGDSDVDAITVSPERIRVEAGDTSLKTFTVSARRDADSRAEVLYVDHSVDSPDVPADYRSARVTVVVMDEYSGEAPGSSNVPRTLVPARTPTTGGGSGSPSGGGGGGGGGPAQSSDASLDTLEVGGDSLDPDPDTDNYPVNAYGETSLTLTPTASDRGARITVNGERVRSGRPHTVTLEDDGETVIEIVVTAEDGTTRRTYTLTVMSCPAEERKILEMFYVSTQGDMWKQRSGWNTDADLRDWHGVDTDEDGNVRSLRLPRNGLSGKTPRELVCFSELKELALWNNELSGEVPDELARAVERAVLRDVAVALSLNPGWFDDYEVADLFDFSDWHEGVMTDDEGRVTELDFTGEEITGEIPGSVLELKSLTAIERECGVALEVEAPGRVSVTPLPESCSDASLENIEISPGELEFDPMNLSYEVAVGYGPESVTVTPTASESEAVITVNGETVQSGSPATVALQDDGETEIKIVVTAEDGMTTRTYGITVARCGEDDIWALSRFYEAVGGQNWNDNTNWNSQEPLDLWFGVSTDENEKAVSLLLAGNNLEGETPRELVCLSEIKELALWDNELSGEVPEELALAVERAALRDVAEALNLNHGWFDDYGDPFSFSDWHEGVTTDDDERVTELDFTGEDITGEIPGSVFELKRLTAIETGCEVTLEIEAPGRVSVMRADGCGAGGCALGRGDSSVSAFGLFLVTLLVFAALGRRRAQI